MGNLSERLMEELNVETAFTIPIFGGIDIPESVAVTWIIMAVLAIASFLLTRGFTVVPTTKRQLFIETLVEKIYGMLHGMVGEEGKAYIPYLGTVLIYIGISNIIGLFGMKPPTKDLNVTAALGIMSIVLIEYAGIRKKGTKLWLKGFAQPAAVILPINILEVFTKPVSLCMRLFGNVLGAFVVMELIKIIIPIGLPVVFSLYFDLFDGLLQAYVFVFLTGLYIKEATE